MNEKTEHRTKSISSQTCPMSGLYSGHSTVLASQNNPECAILIAEQKT